MVRRSCGREKDAGHLPRKEKTVIGLALMLAAVI